MRLKRLELQGFKSFAGKTVLDFPERGIVSIVGPNGSGKSNVIDAIRWLLGEREAKNLRGGKAEDLIFGGTDGKSRVGMAEASIYFENIEGVGSEFSEVAVSRKIFRDGESQYFLNKAEVRLKDIIDFFASVKLGTRGLTIINQGNSDLFVKAAPAERREMIEEILGLRQYQLKRHDAELKLRATDVNLEKVSAMVDELLPRLKLLRRQAAKWAEHANIEAELKDLENKYYSIKIKELDSEADKITPQIKSLENEIFKKSEELRKFQVILSDIQKNRPGEHSQVEVNKKRQFEIAQRKSYLERDLGRLEAKLEFSLEAAKVDVKEAELVITLKDARASLAEILEYSNLEELKSSLRNVIQKIDLIFEGKKPDTSGIKAEIEKAKNQLVLELEGLNGELENIDRQSAEISKNLEDFNNRFQKAFEAVEIKKDELNRLESQKSKLNFDYERINLRLGDFAEQIRQIGREMGEFRSASVPTDLPPDFMVTAERRMLKLRGELASIGEIDQAMLTEAKETEDRYTFLSRQVEDLVKASADLKNLIKDLRERIKNEFTKSLNDLNEHFGNYFRLMFGGGKARLMVLKREPVKVEEGESEVIEEGVKEESQEEDHEDDIVGLDMDVTLPKKSVKGLDTLSGGEKSLVSIAILFALISISPPPFLVLDEVDAALDENNTRRFANLVKEFSKKAQFIIVTHNRATMEVADILYGVTMGADGASKLLSVKLE